MKDKKAREVNEEIAKAVDYLRGRICDVETFARSVSIEDCPKCKHPVLAVEKEGEIIEGSRSCFYGGISYDRKPNYHQCLTCGVKFVCSNKQVCEVVKDD